MIRITLTDAQKEQLGQTFKTTSEPYLRDRCQAVLRAARGRKHGPIAEDLGVPRGTVQEWLRQYRQGGLAALHIHGEPPARIAQPLASEILAWVKGGPQSWGLHRAHGTFAELAPPLYQTQGIEVSETTMREFGPRLEIRPDRPTYRFLRPHPQTQETARQELVELKNVPTTASASCSARMKHVFPWGPRSRRRLGSKAIGRW
jgi:transposase